MFDVIYIQQHQTVMCTAVRVSAADDLNFLLVAHQRNVIMYVHYCFLCILALRFPQAADAAVKTTNDNSVLRGADQHL